MNYMAIAAASTMMATTVLAAAPGTAHAQTSYVRFAPNSNEFLFLDVSGGSTSNGAKVIQWSLSGENQVWYFQAASVDGYFQIVNKHSGKCLMTSGQAGDQLFQWDCFDDTRQRWYTTNVQGLPYAGLKKKLFVSAVGTNLVIDVSGGSGWQGAPVITWYINAEPSPNQRWNLLSAL
jgi:hypothetical protein